MWLLLEMRDTYNKMAKSRIVVLGMGKKKEKKYVISLGGHGS